MRPQAAPVQGTSLAVIPDALRRPLRSAALGLLVLVVAGAAALGLRGEPVAVPVAQQTSAPSALLLSGSSLSYADAQLAAQELGWELTAYSLPGAGISRSTLDPDESILQTARRLLPVQGAAPDVVVIQGGEADHASTPARLGWATERLLEHVRASTGSSTRVVLVGPIPGTTVPPSMVVVNGVLAGVAQEQGVVYVDALAQGWLAGASTLPAGLAAELGRAVPGR